MFWNTPGSLLFLPDTVAHLLEHVHGSGIHRPVLVNTEIDRHGAAILHTAADVVAQRLRDEMQIPII
jgi:hypothetical protein